MEFDTKRRLALIEYIDLRLMIECVEKEIMFVQFEKHKNNENGFLPTFHADLSTGLWLLEGFRVAEAIEIEAVWRVIDRGLLQTPHASRAKAITHASLE